MNRIKPIISLVFFNIILLHHIDAQEIFNTDSTKSEYIPFGNIDVSKINNSFYTRLGDENTFFNIISMSDTVNWYFIPPSGSQCNRYNHLRITDKEILVYSYSKLLFDENMDVKIPLERYLKVQILNKDLQNLYTLFYHDTKLLFIYQFIYSDKDLQEVLIKIDKQADLHNLELNPDYSWLDTAKLIPVSLYVPHYNFNFIPYIWMECVDTPNVLLYNYLYQSEGKYRRLYDAIGKEK